MHISSIYSPFLNGIFKSLALKGTFLSLPKATFTPLALLNAPTEGKSVPQVRKTAVDTGPTQWKGQAAADFAETDSSAAVLVQLFNCNRTGTIGEEISFQPILKGEKIRKRLKFVLGANALLCISATLLGCFIISEEEGGLTTWRVTMHAGLALTSLLQLPVIVFYWSQSLKYQEICRSAYRLSKDFPKNLTSSRIQFLLCVLECSFHLLTLIPVGTISFPLPASTTSISLNDLLYWLIVLRCYGLVRLFYWTSSLSQGRTELYAKLTSSKYGLAFILRACINEYKYRLVIVAYGVMAALPALLKYLVERHSLDGLSLWDQIWLFAYSEATIGYGDFPTSIWLSRLLLILSSFAGLCAMGFLSSVSSHDLSLTRAQSNLCAELLVRKVRIRQLVPVTFLLQSWWRLMRMRRMRLISGPVILGFYGRLGKFRKLLTQRERVKHGFFDHQIVAFDSSVRNRIRKLSEYLQPINGTASLVFPT